MSTCVIVHRKWTEFLIEVVWRYFSQFLPRLLGILLKSWHFLWFFLPVLADRVFYSVQMIDLNFYQKCDADVFTSFNIQIKAHSSSFQGHPLSLTYHASDGPTCALDIIWASMWKSRIFIPTQIQKPLFSVIAHIMPTSGIIIDLSALETLKYSPL